MADKTVKFTGKRNSVSPGATSLHSGLKNRSPKAPKAQVSGPSVSGDATRSSTASTPKTLGPRVA